MTWKDGLLIAGAIVAGLYAYNRFVRRPLPGPTGEPRASQDRNVAAARANLGPKAVAEAAKLAVQGPTAYASAQEDGKTQKVG